MKPKEQILQFIQQNYANALQPGVSGKDEKDEIDSPQNDIIQEIFDGMSTGTARIIIEREMSQALQEKFNVDQVKNLGRYYLARIVRHDGTTIQNLLVDKQTGNVRMAGK